MWIHTRQQVDTKKIEIRYSCQIRHNVDTNFIQIRHKVDTTCVLNRCNVDTNDKTDTKKIRHKVDTKWAQ